MICHSGPRPHHAAASSQQGPTTLQRPVRGIAFSRWMAAAHVLEHQFCFQGLLGAPPPVPAVSATPWAVTRCTQQCMHPVYVPSRRACPLAIRRPGGPACRASARSGCSRATGARMHPSRLTDSRQGLAQNPLPRRRACHHACGCLTTGLLAIRLPGGLPGCLAAWLPGGSLAGWHHVDIITGACWHHAYFGLLAGCAGMLACWLANLLRS